MDAAAHRETLCGQVKTIVDGMHRNNTMKTRIRPMRVLLAFLEALAIALAVLYLGEYFGWHWVREAGGVVFGAGL